MEFFNVRKREKVEISDDKIKKVAYGKDTNRVRYAVRATDDDGTNLTKFVTKATFDSLNVPEE